MLGYVENTIKQEHIKRQLDDNTFYDINLRLINTKYNYAIIMKIKEYRCGELNRSKTQTYNKFDKIKEDKSAAEFLFDVTHEQLMIMDEYDLKNFFI